MAPWLKMKKGNLKRVIAAFEMLASLVAINLWPLAERWHKEAECPH
jgi:hypothetical protein